MSFDTAFAYMLGDEDAAFNCDVIIDNNGAETICGINGKSYPKIVEQLKAIPDLNVRRNAVKGFYRQRYWAPKFDEIQSCRIQAKIFDLAVNMDPAINDRDEAFGQAIKIVQRAVGCTDDGIFGSQTVAVLNAALETPTLAAICQKAKEFYLALAVEHPEDERYRSAWLARAARVPDGSGIGSCQSASTTNG